MDDKRVFGYCEYCGSEINDAGGEYYMDPEGRVYCNIECALEKFEIIKIEV